MADILEELKLSHYYPQKLSFNEAIHLRGETQNDSERQYGIEIVRKLLMFDSTAVISVTADINERLSNTFKNETEAKDQSGSHGVRSRQRGGGRQQTPRSLHPMDLLVVVMNCCDDFLRQVLVEKMFVNKLSIPILFPYVRNGSHALLLLALKSLVPEVQDRKRESSSSSADTIIEMRNPVVSFIRVGDLKRSKSKLVNEVLRLKSFDTFFHRECSGGPAKRLVSNGSIEAAWFQSKTATEKEFNCTFFTALNLRGDAKDYLKQTQFLCQSSTLTVFMVDSFESLKEFYETVHNYFDVSQTKIIVCHISSNSSDEYDEASFELWDDVIDSVIYADEEKMSDVDFANDLRKRIFELLIPKHEDSYQMPSYTNIIQTGENFGFSLDADKSNYKAEKLNSDKFVDLLLHLPLYCKPTVLPLQGEPWGQIGKLEREQRGKSQDRNPDENFIAEKESEKRRQRQIQCRSLIHQSEVTQTFSIKFHDLEDQKLLYYLNSCKITLDSRSRVITSNLLHEYTKEKHKYSQNLPNEPEPGVNISKLQSKIANSTFGMEHFLRECGQMYEAIHSEEFRMREELKKVPITPNVILNFPTRAATLLLKGHPLELMDGDASNVPITWLKAVLSQVAIMTNNAKVFVLSIIGVQSSGKSTLLNALFGLQFPVSSGRCTRGIYCHLVPVDKGSLIVNFDYALIVDTEGLGSSEFTGKSTFRDNELATFAIGLADATIINMKGENWAEMKDILQVVAYGLIRVRKTKAELELMPRCMFVHQNVPAADAEEKNRLGQEKQLMHLDTAVRVAACEEDFKDINSFDDVIKVDPESHSWYFPDLWSGSPPNARISQDYIGKSNELRQYLMQLMRKTPSSLTISGFVLRMSDLWNAMLHNDFVLCFRNTKDIMLGTNLNDRIAHQLDNFKKLNRLEQKKIYESIMHFVSIEELHAEKERLLNVVRDAVEQKFSNIKAILKDIIDTADIDEDLKKKYDVSLSEIKEEELRRVIDETEREISVHTKTLEIGNCHRVEEFKCKLAYLEKCVEEVEKDKFNQTVVNEFQKEWEQLFDAKTLFVNDRRESAKQKIKETILASIENFDRERKLYPHIVSCPELFETPITVQMPQVTRTDVSPISKSDVHQANIRNIEAYTQWKIEFQNRIDLEFDPSHLEQILFEVCQLLDIIEKEKCEVPPETDEIGLSIFTDDYTIELIKFACNYAYNRSLENSERFILLTDPLADIEERYYKSVSNFPQVSAEANIDDVSQKIFSHARRAFMKDLGELVKAEVCKEGNANPMFQSKRAFLRAILVDLAQETTGLSSGDMVEEKKILFEKFMLYLQMAESKESKHFFHNAITKLLKNVLISEGENESQSVFYKMVESNVGKIIEKAMDALRHADANSNGCSKEYIRILKNELKVTSEFYLRIHNLNGFTESVVKKLKNVYDEFLGKANSSFETLVCEDIEAAIRPLFEKIMGCRERCPFCSAPCSQSLEKHPDDHRANHYPMGLSGTVNVSDYSAEVQGIPGAAAVAYKRKLTLSTCQTMVGSSAGIGTAPGVMFLNTLGTMFLNTLGAKATAPVAIAAGAVAIVAAPVAIVTAPSLAIPLFISYAWHSFAKILSNEQHPFNKYKELAEYKRWDIPFSSDPNASLYWKWFVAQFGKELAEHYNALCPVIPEAWQNITWEEAKRSLDD